ncbi:uncharacterized protein LOC108109276 [Drosophila eugracilis]|uniref:uncharacterized protein LOC108109276 n=1 Tax=Drosophila eugracilis TaxID=29029 RepID=UPI0007E60534|nr:uncharacterized protein LOC108109276 [Drosophila eugracilis]
MVDFIFKISILPDENVVSVGCPGFNTELFIPQIVSGRLTLQNILPHRRCCPESRMLSDPLSGVMGTRTPTRRSNHNSERSTPLAQSTPAMVPIINSRGKENIKPHVTPEVVRFRPFPQASLGEDNINIISDDEWPSQKQSSESICVTSLEPQLPALIDIHPEPRISPGVAELRNNTPRMPPLRTYTRKNAGTTSKKKPTAAWSPLQKRKRIASISATKVPSPTMKLEVRQRKLIVDTKKTLEAHDPSKYNPVPITKKKIIRKQVNGKTRKQFEALKVTAFDLLTFPCKTTMSKNLIKQFQGSCMNKVCTTLPNYAEIAVVSPIQTDREVKTLVARQKRMDHINQKFSAVMSKSKVI